MHDPRTARTRPRAAALLRAQGPVAPEPATALRLPLGLLGLAASRRGRS